MGKVGDSSDINPTARPVDILGNTRVSESSPLSGMETEQISFFDFDIDFLVILRQTLTCAACRLCLNSAVCYIEGRKSCVSASVIRVIAPHPFSALLTENPTSGASVAACRTMASTRKHMNFLPLS